MKNEFFRRCASEGLSSGKAVYDSPSAVAMLLAQENSIMAVSDGTQEQAGDDFWGN